VRADEQCCAEFPYVESPAFDLELKTNCYDWREFEDLKSCDYQTKSRIESCQSWLSAMASIGKPPISLLVYYYIGNIHRRRA